MSDRSQGEAPLVQFSERLTNSAAFGNLFREGMDLVEETAVYDEQIIARSRARVQPQPFLWFPASCFPKIAGRRPRIFEELKGPGNLMTLVPLFGGTSRRDWDQNGDGAKKEPPFPAAFEVDNREASNRVDRSHSVSKRGQC